MKITFVLPPVNMSGGIRVVAVYASRLAARGHEVVLVSTPAAPRRLPLRRRLRALVAPRPLAARGPAKSHLDGLGLNHRLLDTWRPVTDDDVPDADVVIATWWETAEWVAALGPAKGRKVYFVQGYEVFPWLPQERCRATYHLPLRKIVVARWLARVMCEEHGDCDATVVNNSIDHDQFFAVPRAKQDRPTVGFLYSNVPIKGVEVTLRAIELLRGDVPDLRVVSFGNHPPEQTLPSFVEFTLDPPQHRLRDLYAACDVWLTASRSEGFNLPAMEAMACRTPVVSTRTGWPEEALVDGVNGACVAIDDADALATEARRLLTLSDEQWRRVSQAAFDTVAGSSWARATDLFEQVLVDAAAGRPSAPGVRIQEHRAMASLLPAAAGVPERGAGAMPPAVPKASPPDVSVIVVNYNTAHLLHDMRAALLAARGALALQTIVIDNASRDDSLDVLRRDFGEVELVANEVNVGFGRANNQGVERATGRYVLLLNTDAFVSPDTLRKTVGYMDAHLDCGVLGVRLVGRDGELQPSCRYFPTPWNVFLARTGLARRFPSVRLVDDMSWDHAGVRECDWVTGCYYLVRREVIERIGLFDPRYFLYCEEMDHCRRTKQAGWKVVYFGDTSVVHLGGESAKSDGELTAAGKQISALQVESELLYFRKHHGLAGVLAAVLLSTATDLALILKRWLAPRREPRPAGQGKHLTTLWSLLAATRLGTRPTR